MEVLDFVQSGRAIGAPSLESEGGHQWTIRELQARVQNRLSLLCRSFEDSQLPMVGRPLVVASPGAPKRLIKWLDHTTPTIALDGTLDGVRAIGPGVTSKGPLGVNDVNDSPAQN
jgi:hypothetical protein